MRERAEAQSENVKSNCHAELVSASVQRCALPVSLDRCRNHLARLAKNGTARACAKERGLSRRALDSTQGKPCSVALLGLTFTMTARLSRFHNGLVGLRSAFTMAEILLSLTIIGVVAAITLPSLTGNINERTWNTQRKALYARFSQAIALMPALNGYGTLTEGDSSTSAVDTAAETFVTAGLAKVLKINNICDNEHLEDCGITSTFTTLAASEISVPATYAELNPRLTSVTDSLGTFEAPDTKAAAFETANGESIIAYYNPNCVPDLGITAHATKTQPYICANFVYDLNGLKGPNTVGKDIGAITVLYPSDSVVVAPIPIYHTPQSGLTPSEGANYCTSLENDARIPNKDEAISLFVNQNLFGQYSDRWILTSSQGLNSSNRLAQWTQSTWTGNRLLTDGTTGFTYIQCVKR